jgi:essential nuclear protein 1
LNILGLADDHMGEEAWEKKLENKLKEVNSKSIDNPEVRRVYGEIGKIFATYRSGKVPKAFKVIPNLDKWREVIQLTHP